MEILVIAIPVLILLAGAVVFATARRRDVERGTGVLSRETRKRDRSTAPFADEEEAVALSGREVERAAVLERRPGGGTGVAVVDKAPPVPRSASRWRAVARTTAPAKRIRTGMAMARISTVRS